MNGLSLDFGFSNVIPLLGSRPRSTGRHSAALLPLLRHYYAVASAALTKTLSRIQLDWNWPTTAYNLATIDYNADKTFPLPIEVSFRIA